ncbi:OmpA family protein [Gaoshiqia sp. Z1-71]|uniref:OmpA family protein n=1 Tax=Gaoshiqia hydrogeniformans TaxID=3290090 RepID=UPI003BF851A0
MKHSLFYLFLLFGSFVSGQDLSSSNKKAVKLFNEGRTYYESRENEKAMEKLQGAIKEDGAFADAYLLLADVYGEMDSVLLQIQMLEQAISLIPDKYPKAYYVMGNACYRAGSYQKAKDAYLQYLEMPFNSNLSSKAKERVERCDFALNMLRSPKSFNAKNLGDAINTEFDEYWPSLTIDGSTVIFTRLIPVDYPVNELLPRFQEDFFESRKVKGEWQPAEPILSINTMQNEGAQSISADGKLIFFTACNRPDGYGSCDIYFSRNIGGVWSKPQNAGTPVNSGAWESQPSVSANGEYLYFVSNRKNGKGGMDIWRCRLDGFTETGKAKWGKLQNLGDSINTPGDEMSPFIHPDGQTLYFASDYWPGMGRADIFYSRVKNDSVWHQPVNLGYPINTHKDEQGLIVDASGKNAYYSSDRPGSKGVDIYRFELYPEVRPTPVSYIKGRVIDFETGKPLCSIVELVDIEKDQVAVKTESCIEPGEFLMCLPLGKEYAFNVSREGYLFFSENFSLRKVRNADDPVIMEIPLKKIEMGGSTVLRNIFFETDSYELLDQSKTELSRLISFLRKNPALEIEIGGHTDNVGGDEYNINLSEKRAEAVFQYLVDAGIAEMRLSYKGYGKSQPLESNDRAEGRSRNRRTEFKIIGMK